MATLCGALCLSPCHLSHWAVFGHGALWPWLDVLRVSGNEESALTLNLAKGGFGQENSEAGHMGQWLAFIVDKQLPPACTSDRENRLPATRI